MIISLPANLTLYYILATILFIAYLLGSLSFGLISSKLFKLPDPRSFGSKNIGATNMLRGGHKIAAVVTLLGDALKGGLAILCAQAIVNLSGTSFTGDSTHGAFIFLAGLAAFLGHLYPITLKFKGGKGVATAVGVLLFLLPKLALVLMIIWLLTLYISKYSSLAALLAASSCILLTLLNSYGNQFIKLFEPLSIPQQLCIITMSAMLIYKHKANIIRLIQGSEPKIGQKTPAS